MQVPRREDERVYSRQLRQNVACLWYALKKSAVCTVGDIWREKKGGKRDHWINTKCLLQKSGIKDGKEKMKFKKNWRIHKTYPSNASAVSTPGDIRRWTKRNPCACLFFPSERQIILYSLSEWQAGDIISDSPFGVKLLTKGFHS